MDEATKAKIHVTSAVAFVEDGMQDACDDACSICLEAFCDSNPSTVTSCKHEFHLQCVLEWCQRSSSCPMCWQPISLKDPSSQELLEAVERERRFRSTPSRNAAIFHHPTLGDFELQHLPVGLDAAELEDRIVRHFAAAIGRTGRTARREVMRSSSPHTHPQLVLLSSNRNASSAGPDGTETESAAAPTLNNLSPPCMPSPIRINRTSGSSSRSPAVVATRQGISNSSRSHELEPSLANVDPVGPSEFQSISDTWKSRFSTMSMIYKDSISKSTKGWKDKLFSRSSSMAEIGSEVMREVNAGMASVSRMMDRLETRENNIATRSSGADGSPTGHSNQADRVTGQYQ